MSLPRDRLPIIYSLTGCDILSHSLQPRIFTCLINKVMGKRIQLQSKKLHRRSDRTTGKIANPVIFLLLYRTGQIVAR